MTEELPDPANAVPLTPGRRGQVALVVVRAGSYGLAALASLVVARTLGINQYGDYALAAAVVNACFLFGLLGIDQLYLQAEVNLAGTWRAATWIASSATFATAGAAMLWPGLVQATRLTVLFLGLAAAGGLWLKPWLLARQKKLEFGRVAWRELAVSVPSTVAVIIAATTTRSSIWTGGASACAVVLVVLFIAMLQIVRKDSAEERDAFPPMTLRRSWELMRRGSSYALSGALYAIYFSIDIAILGTIRGSAQVGFYQVASNFFLAASLLPVALNNDILRPRLYHRRAHQTGQRSLELRFGVATAVSGMGIGIVFGIGGPWLVAAIFGHRYLQSGPLLQILALAIIPHYINSWAGNVALARSMVKPVLVIQAVLASGNIIANVLLVPRFGSDASAWITVVTEFAGCAGYIVLLVAIWGWPSRPSIRSVSQ